MPEDPWEPIRPYMIDTAKDGSAVLWRRDEGGGRRTEVQVFPPASVRLVAYGPRGGEVVLLGARPSLEETREVLTRWASEMAAVRLAADLLAGDATAGMTWGLIRRGEREGWKT